MRSAAGRDDGAAGHHAAAGACPVARSPGSGRRGGSRRRADARPDRRRCPAPIAGPNVDRRDAAGPTPQSRADLARLAAAVGERPGRTAADHAAGRSSQPANLSGEPKHEPVPSEPERERRGARSALSRSGFAMEPEIRWPPGSFAGVRHERRNAHAARAAGGRRADRAQPLPVPTGTGPPGGVAARSPRPYRPPMPPVRCPIPQPGCGVPVPAPLVAAKFLAPQGRARHRVPRHRRRPHVRRAGGRSACGPATSTASS